MKSEEEDDIHLPSPAMFNPLATPPTLLPFPSAQALVHQQKPLYGQQCCFYSCYIYPQSCPSGAAGTADLKQSFTLMTGGQSRNSRMLTSTVIWPAESYRGWREIHSLMTTTNTDVTLFQRYNSRLQWDCFLLPWAQSNLCYLDFKLGLLRETGREARCVSLANSCQHDSVKLLISDINNASRQMRLTFAEYESLA